MFRYFADPLWISGCLAYAANRFWLKAHVHSAFLHGQFNDSLLIPCALPPLLWLHRRLGLRNHDRPPTAAEIGFHLVIWSILFEALGPFLFRHATGDFRDVIAYFGGGLVAWCYWNWSRQWRMKTGFAGWRRSFDLLAPHYLWMERLLAGNLLQRCRTAYLPLREARSVLILGPGRGLFLDELLNSNPDAAITCIDSSARMLEETRKRVVQSGADPGRVKLIHADALQTGPQHCPGAPFDVIVSHFFLDCFKAEQIDQLVERVVRLSTPDVTWLLADFAIPPAGFWRLRARLILRLAYTFFRITTDITTRELATPDPSLQRNGFRLLQRRNYEHGLLHSDLWQRQL